MQCFRCGQILAKNNWKPSQWRERCPLVYPYVGCKQCHTSGPTDAMCVIYGRMRHHLSLHTEEKGREQTEFLMEWRSRQGEFSQHKSLSHHGALPAVLNFHPRHWDDPDGQYDFDPGNHVYARAMQRACPDFLMRTGMSDQKKIADCIRAVLQLDWTLRRSLRVNEERTRSLAALHDPWPRSGISLHKAALFWLAFSYRIWFIDLIENWPTC